MVCKGLVYHRRIRFPVIEEGYRLEGILKVLLRCNANYHQVVPWIKYMAINPKQIVYQKFTIYP